MPPLLSISAFRRTDVTGGSRGEAMPERENVKNVNIVLGRAKRQSRAKREQIMTDSFAFGEHSCVPSVASEQSSSGRRLSHLGKFNTCQWHSACTKSAFGEPTHARPIASKLAWRSLNRGLGHSNNFATLSLLPLHPWNKSSPSVKECYKGTTTLSG